MLQWRSISNVLSIKLSTLIPEGVVVLLNRSAYNKRERLAMKKDEKRLIETVRDYPLVKDKHRMGELLYRCTLLPDELFEHILLLVLGSKVKKGYF
jgi:hypothetical protein